MLSDMLIFDAHCDTANVILDTQVGFPENTAHMDLEKVKRGGLKAQIFAVWVDPLFAPHRAIKRALSLFHVLEEKIFIPGYGEKVTTTGEMKQCIVAGKLACWLFLEGGHIIENSLRILEVFRSLGFRGMTLTHTKNTDWADSSGDDPLWHGLNRLGREVVERMDDLDMIIDVSHASDETVQDVLAATSKPVMASHSNARDLCNVPRNLPDELISEIGARNGFIGVNFFPAFLKRTVYTQILDNFKKLEADHQEKIKGKEDDPETVSRLSWELYHSAVEGNDPVDLSVVIDHIEHVIKIGGIDCVGLGSDFDGIPSTPTDLRDVTCYPVLIDGFRERGFEEGDIRKIMGENLRAFLERFE